MSRAIAAACALALITASTQPSAMPADAGASGRNQAIVVEAFEAWAAGSNVFADLLAPDVAWTVHGSGPAARSYRGRDDFVRQASQPLTSRLATPLVPKIHNIWAGGDTVVVRFEASATTTSGRPYSNQFVWIFRMKDGSVTEAEAFLDLAAYQEVIEQNEPRKP
ncbi:nuclear transport factor 2 family protein [Teichococcus oryzae]|nr:nuclear transport factor 2 family protein [Pseudoroseomonas oryzae]